MGESFATWCVTLRFTHPALVAHISWLTMNDLLDDFPEPGAQVSLRQHDASFFDQ